MRKIPTLFERDWEGDRSLVLDRVVPGCEWVLAGEGVATRKYDGTCVMLDEDGSWWARREVKAGKDAPSGFLLEETDETTGKRVGWEPIDQSPFYRFFVEALAMKTLEPGTYELCGPKVQGNPEDFALYHVLVKHDEAPSYEVERSFAGIRDFLADHDVEGLVFHHGDGRMAKIKKCDFGLRR